MLRVCAEPWCGNVTDRGRCDDHRRSQDRGRQTAAARGYDRHWTHFRRRLVERMIDRMVLPVCGARLDGTPSPHSRCAAEGRLTDRSADGSDLHFDHDPPLTDAERGDWRAVCDERRVALLCAQCHQAKSNRERGVRGR